MDNLTHTLFALTLARTPLGRGGHGVTAALILSSNIPDVDAVAAFDGAARYLEWHRGPTHGPLGVIGLGVVTAALVWGTYVAMGRAHGPVEARATKRPAPFGTLLVASLAGVLMHILMDLPTSYGTRLFSPFDWRWFAVDLLPIIDVYLLLALIAGLAIGRWGPRHQTGDESGRARRARAAVAVLGLMLANYALRGVTHGAALALAMRAFGPTLPPACDQRAATIALLDSWPAAAVAATPGDRTPCLIDIAAIPSFVSPFDWRVIAQLPDAYEIFEIDVLDPALRQPSSRESLRARASRVPNAWTPLAVEASRTEEARILLGFSRFPKAETLRDPSGGAAVVFTDVRFSDPAAPRALRERRSDLFTVTVPASGEPEPYIQ
jgi:membrane-bound metal-dependent hydrolase YbcI (DUF457 family)